MEKRRQRRRSTRRTVDYGSLLPALESLARQEGYATFAEFARALGRRRLEESVAAVKVTEEALA